MSEKDYKELLSIRTMAQMLVEKAERLIEKKERPVSTGTSKNKMKKEVEKFLLKRKNTRMRRGIRIANANQQNLK